MATVVKLPEHIYESSLLDVNDSDVILEIFGEQWKLHKIILCQSQYFSSMFETGRWIENKRPTIPLVFPDSKITTETIKAVFDYMYTNQLSLNQENVLGILATACHFQFEGLLHECDNFMSSCINNDTVDEFYENGKLYGIYGVLKSCHEWLLWNFIEKYSNNTRKLQTFAMEQMLELIKDCNLYTINEIKLYVVLRKWMFLKLTESPCHNNIQCENDCHNFFVYQPNGYFLETPRGKPFVPVFRALRLEYCIHDSQDIELMERERVIPRQWISAFVLQNFITAQKIQTCKETNRATLNPGISSVTDVYFERLCSRWGNILRQEPDDEICWEWKTFHYGLNIRFNYCPKTYKTRILCTKWNNMVIPPTSWKIVYKLTIAEWNEETGGTLITLNYKAKVNLKESLRTIQWIKKKMKFPIMVRLMLLITLPENMQFYIDPDYRLQFEKSLISTKDDCDPPPSKRQRIELQTT